MELSWGAGCAGWVLGFPPFSLSPADPPDFRLPGAADQILWLFIYKNKKKLATNKSIALVSNPSSLISRFTPILPLHKESTSSNLHNCSLEIFNDS